MPIVDSKWDRLLTEILLNKQAQVRSVDSNGKKINAAAIKIGLDRSLVRYNREMFSLQLQTVDVKFKVFPEKEGMFLITIQQKDPLEISLVDTGDL